MTTTLERIVRDTADPAVYIAPVAAKEMFADPTYQRDLDQARVKTMARTWNPRLLGVLDISDRGDTGTGAPRYAIINGQHRAAAARLVDEDTILVANIHTGLSVADEAKLFYDIDAKTRRLTGWDRWKSRRGAGDPTVIQIEKIVTTAGLTIDMAPTDGNIRCVSTLEKVYALGGEKLLRDALDLIAETWGHRLDAVDAPLVHGVARVLHSYDCLDVERLGEVLIDIAPRQVKARAQALRETETGQISRLVALVIIGAYNSSRGLKLHRDELR
ncbi:DUF6551 family protein [Nocardia neocaledoniensis]|uniref:DUF6551 family protein n=1 Tax=Nocardia neocaledoniensis TaxID=236511 RepID=UPI0033D421F5